jgi:hypothetical protein
LNRISFAFRSFFSILFRGALPPDVVQAITNAVMKAADAKREAPSSAQPPKPAAGPSDGAVQMLAVLQRDARLVDFLMEDISPYTDAQVGAAIRDVQVQAREALNRYLRLIPVLDGVEGEFTPAANLAPAEVKFIGNVPSDGKAPGGLLRHKGWKAQAVDLPAATPGRVIAPAELEIE